MKMRAFLVFLAVVVVIASYSGTALALGNEVEHHGDSVQSNSHIKNLICGTYLFSIYSC